MSSKFVQIKALGSKLAPAQGVFFPFMYIIKTLKNLLFKKPQELELRYLA
jgi:hypothetical protein